MIFLNSQSSLTSDYLYNNDLIHNEGEISHEGLFKESESQQLFDVFSSEDLCLLKELFIDNFKLRGHIINNTYFMLTNPFLCSKIRKIVQDKIYKILGEEIIFYNDISNDPISVGDHIFLIKRAYFPHTDSITHIPGFAPYKDVIIPIASHNDIKLKYYTCKQRYYKRATHFKYGYRSDYYSNYANLIKYTSYDKYGIKNFSEKSFDRNFYESNIKSSKIPFSVFKGLSVDRIFDWLPGSIIVHDQSVIHGPTSLRAVNCDWKIGITLHILKKAPSFINKKFSDYTEYSPYTKPFTKGSTKVIEDSLRLPLQLFS